MTPWMFLAMLGMVYSIIYLLDTLFRSHPSTSLKYLIKLRSLGLDVSLFQVRWSTPRYNSTFHWFAQVHPRLVRMWYTIGAVVSSLLILPSMILLIHTLQHHLIPGDTNNTTDRVVLQPVLPGVNLPPSELLYYFTSLLICSVYHETGHAVAAYNCGVRVVCAGLAVLAIFPAAFVELPTDQLENRALSQQLRVFSGGVWHNIVLAGVAWSIATSAPTLFSPGYTLGQGVALVNVKPRTSVQGPSGLVVGDVLTAVQGKSVRNIRDYKIALADVLNSVQGGLCVEEMMVKELRVPGVVNNCCPEERTDSLCFVGSTKGQRVCLPVRSVSNKSAGHCHAWDPFLSQGEGFCGEEVDCMVPQFTDNTTKLVIVTRKKQKDFLFIGNPAEIYSSTEVTEYVPTYSFLPLQLPDIVTKLSNYIATFSAGLAVLNVVPSYLLDGQHMIRVLVEMVMINFSQKNRINVTMSLTVLGSFLIFINILLGLKSVLTAGPGSLVSFTTA